MFATPPFTTPFKAIAIVLAVAAIGVPAAQAAPRAGNNPAETGQLGARTEAAGFIAITKYLVRHAGGAGNALSARESARLGARTEAAGYRAITRYQEQQAAQATVATPTTGFAWRDALIGAGFTAGLVLLWVAAALAVRKRRPLPQLRL